VKSEVVWSSLLRRSRFFSTVIAQPFDGYQQKAIKSKPREYFGAF
jgi:hypothetical protein